MDAERFTLTKAERLSSKRDINSLMAHGKYGTAGSIKYCYRLDNGLSFNRIMITVPKRLFKRAVKRNYLKRLLRESYRRQKSALTVPALDGDGHTGGGTDILFLYNTSEVLDYQSVFAAVGTILNTLNSHVG